LARVDRSFTKPPKVDRLTATLAELLGHES